MRSISIHALLAESDLETVKKSIDFIYFYPRSPCGERRQQSGQEQQLWHFYPRSPCGERRGYVNGKNRQINFYPRSPCGERRSSSCGKTSIAIFLSTLSLRRATGAFMRFLYSLFISIHALLAESDTDRDVNPDGEPKFLSTLSLRRATCYR